MRWLCARSLACSPALPPGRVPHVRGLSRTWVEHDLFPMLSPSVHHLLTGKEKEGPRIRKSGSPILFNPCTRKSANMGHPSRGQGWCAGERSVAQPTHDAYLRYSHILFSLHSPTNRCGTRAPLPAELAPFLRQSGHRLRVCRSTSLRPGQGLLRPSMVRPVARPLRPRV